ncbi:MAG: hypothetical protein HW374_1666, partial [Bacteroidetes bacterium]|nr:hypothetical protein [Bacteroidota bacterium]
PTRPWVTYSWNGSLYGIWPSSPQVPGVTFFPANKLEVAAKCIVTRIVDTLTYVYTWSSKSTSEQEMTRFAFRGLTSTFKSIHPDGWNSSGKWLDIPFADWFTDPFSRESNVRPGQMLSGFNILSKGLPTIAIFYVQGFRPQVDPETGNQPTVQQLRNDLFMNSFRGFSIGPSYPPDPFIPVIFLDTLLSYTRQSAELGWLGRDRDNDCDNDEIPDDGIVRNVEQRLKKAKKQLERGDSVFARRELEKLVSKVERLWKRSQDDEKKNKRDRWEKRDKVVMTSEAYALLKYNTEYLIDRLPDRKPEKGSKDRD